KATLPQFPLRITPIASLYSSSGNLWVRIGFRFTFPLFRSPPICIHVLYISRPWIPYIDSPFVTNSEMSRLSGFGKSPSRWIPPAGRTTRIACWTAASLPETSSTSSTPSPAVASITSSTRDSPDRRTTLAPTFLARSIRYWFLWPIAMTVRADIPRQRATAISPIGPRPKMAIIFPGTFAFVTVYTALPSGSCMDAMSTRIKTSEGVGSGIGTFRTSVLFGAALSFTAAFIIDVMTQVSRPRACAWARRISTLYHSIRPSEAALASLCSTLNRMEFRRAVSHEHEQIFPFVELLVQRGIARVDTEDRRHHEL